MDFVGKIKKAKKGLEDSIDRFGLEADKQYERAYVKGVDVLDYESAAKDFHDASKKFKKLGNNDMELRARANSKIYRLFVSKDRSIIGEMITELESLPEIEQFGTRDTLVQTSPLITELKAIQLEYEAEQVESNEEKRELYSRARDIITKLNDETLSFADKIGISGPTDIALFRSVYYEAFSDFYGGLVESMISPTIAHDLFKNAFDKFDRVGASDRADETKGYIADIELKRHCWMCGREMQGRNIHYHYYPTNIAKYQKNLVESSGGDISMLDKDGHITLCIVCGSVIEKQADIYSQRRAKEIIDWVSPILDGLAHRMDYIERTQRNIENTQSELESKQNEFKDELNKPHREIHYN